MKFYTYVDKPGEKLNRVSLLLHQTAKRVIGDETFPETCIAVSPNAEGVFTIDENNANYKLIVKKIKRRMGVLNKEGEPPVLVGPYDSHEDARLAAVRLRPKTPEEQVAETAVENEALKRELEKANATINRTREKNVNSQKEPTVVKAE